VHQVTVWLTGYPQTLKPSVVLPKAIPAPSTLSTDTTTTDRINIIIIIYKGNLHQYRFTNRYLTINRYPYYILFYNSVLYHLPKRNGILTISKDQFIVTALSMKWSGSTKYGFAVGRVRFLETTLLDRGRYDRLIQVSDLSGMRTVLTDTVYGRFLGERDAGVNLEKVFISAGSDNFSFLTEYCINPWVLNIFRLGADICNLKTVLKERVADIKPDLTRQFHQGNWNNEALSDLAEERPRAKPVQVRNVITSVLRDYEKEHDPALLDFRLDQLEQEMALELASRSPFLTGLFLLHADIENLRTFIRVRVLGKAQALLDRAFLPGGSIAVSFLASLLKENWDAVVTRFCFSLYRRLIENGAGYAVTRGSLVRMERLSREMELSYLRQTRYATFGYEPLVSYYLFRENELTNLRQIYAAKKAGMPREEQKELVAYVD